MTTRSTDRITYWLIVKAIRGTEKATKRRSSARSSDGGQIPCRATNSVNIVATTVVATSQIDAIRTGELPRDRTKTTAIEATTLAWVHNMPSALSFILP